MSPRKFLFLAGWLATVPLSAASAPPELAIIPADPALSLPEVVRESLNREPRHALVGAYRNEA